MLFINISYKGLSKKRLLNKGVFLCLILKSKKKKTYTFEELQETLKQQGNVVYAQKRWIS